MHFVFDAIITALCIFIIVLSCKKGFIKSLTGLIKGVVSFIAAYAFTPMLASYVDEHFMLKRISSGIEKTISSLSGNGNGTFDLAGMFDKMDSSLKQIIDRYGADEDVISGMCRGNAAADGDTVSKLAKYIASPVSDTLSKALSFIAIFIAVFVALSLIAFLLNAVFKLPVLRSANKFLGLVFGVLEAFVLAVCLSNVLASLSVGLGSINSSLFGREVVENSVVMKFFSTVDLFGLIDSVIK